MLCSAFCRLNIKCQLRQREIKYDDAIKTYAKKKAKLCFKPIMTFAPCNCSRTCTKKLGKFFKYRSYKKTQNGDIKIT